MSTNIRALPSMPKPIKGRGLTNPGIVILQLLLILFLETIEYSLAKVGIITGLAIWIALLGGFYLGRSGTTFATVVNPPIAFFISSIILIGTVGGAGLHMTKFGLDLVTTLGGGAPYLVIGSVLGWAWHLYASRSKTEKVSDQQP